MLFTELEVSSGAPGGCKIMAIVGLVAAIVLPFITNKITEGTRHGTSIVN